MFLQALRSFLSYHMLQRQFSINVFTQRGTFVAVFFSVWAKNKQIAAGWEKCEQMRFLFIEELFQ